MAIKRPIHIGFTSHVMNTSFFSLALQPPGDVISGTHIALFVHDPDKGGKVPQIAHFPVFCHIFAVETLSFPG